MDYRIYFRLLDYRMIGLILALMLISLLVISSTTQPYTREDTFLFFTPTVIRQLVSFFLGWVMFFLFSYMDYRKLRQHGFFIYIGIVLLLIGLFFTDPIQNVRRWYRLPGLAFAIQPSEYAKLAVVIALSFFLERKSDSIRYWPALLQAFLLVFVPFLLIYKQPDLGTALVLLPITLVMFYFGGVSKKVLMMMCAGGIAMLVFVISMFLGFISHEKLRPVATQVLKEYQYERLNPDTYHQRSAQIAIALGSLTGSGWGSSEYTAKKWLPFGETDSVFPAFAEQFGFVGASLLLLIFFGLIYFSFQVSALAKDVFGRLISSGIAVYLAVHVIINMGMMCGLLPITGVPLLLVSYGGSSVMATMMACGILQSVYVRRFMFS